MEIKPMALALMLYQAERRNLNFAKTITYPPVIECNWPDMVMEINL